MPPPPESTDPWVTARVRGVIGPGVLLGSSVGAVAVAVWLVPASLHIVEWDADHPRLVALLAPWRALGLAAAGSVVGMLAVAAAARRFWGTSLAGLARAAAPLGLLWCWTIPYIPGLSTRFPILVALAGPIRWAIAAAALGSVAIPFLAWNAWRGPTRVSRLAIFGVAAIALSSLGFAVTRSQPPGGDEPHYLIVTHSLVADADLRIENNHQQQDYAAFYPDELRPDFLRRGRDDVIYSIHAPGLPFLLAPGYALAGYRGAVATMALFASLAALALFDLVRRFAGLTTSLIGWVLVTFSVPLVPHAWMIYPELPALLIVAWAARWLTESGTGPPGTLGRWALRGVALAYLPWLHTKFAVLLACLTVALIVHLWPIRRSIVAFLAPIATSIAVWMFTSYVMYGHPNPAIAYGGGGGLELSNVPRGLFGLLFDQEFGLLIFTPLYVLAPVGMWYVLRGPAHRTAACWYVGVAAVFLAAVTQVYMWWGGSSAPARFLVPVVPLVAPFIAVAIDRMRGPTGRTLVGMTAVWSVIAVVTGLLSNRLTALLENGDGTGRLVDALAGGAPLTNSLASFFEADWLTPAGATVPWLVAAIGGLLLGGLAARRVHAAGALSGSALGLVGMLVIGSVLGNPRTSEPVRGTIANAGRHSLLMAYDGGRLSGLAYAPIAQLDDSAIVARSWLRSRADERRDLDDGHVLFGPFDLPAGTYEMHVAYREAGVAATWSVAYFLRELRGLLTSGHDAAATPQSFTLPVGLPAIWARFPPSAAVEDVQEIRVVPTHVVPRRDRLDRGVCAASGRSMRPRAPMCSSSTTTLCHERTISG